MYSVLFKLYYLRCLLSLKILLHFLKCNILVILFTFNTVVYCTLLIVQFKEYVVQFALLNMTLTTIQHVGTDLEHVGDDQFESEGAKEPVALPRLVTGVPCGENS